MHLNEEFGAPWVLDLCSGLGGWTQGFIEDFLVVRVDNNPLLQDVEFTADYDVLQWMDWLDDMIEYMGCTPFLITASPPCLEFSTARTWAQGRVDMDPCMKILEACIDIIDRCQPDFWIIENVRGACGHFLPYLGRHKQHIGPFYFWGKFPHISVPQDFKHTKAGADVWSTDPLRANKKALIPIEISNGLLDGICSQRTLYQEWA
tara:strand:- start:99 stop:713 length:615 start_codon:yes stop_codon:yes gene_type:complete